MPETTDLIERLNKRAENGRVFHADRKLFAEAATALSENIETINGRAMDLATLRARLASCEAAVVMAHDFISSEYHDAKSVAMEGEWVSKDARAVFRALSEARAALTKGGEDAQ